MARYCFPLRTNKCTPVARGNRWNGFWLLWETLINFGEDHKVINSEGSAGSITLRAGPKNYLGKHFSFWREPFIKSAPRREIGPGVFDRFQQKRTGVEVYCRGKNIWLPETPWCREIIFAGRNILECPLLLRLMRSSARVSRHSRCRFNETVDLPVANRALYLVAGSNTWGGNEGTLVRRTRSREHTEGEWHNTLSCAAVYLR